MKVVGGAFAAFDSGGGFGVLIGVVLQRFLVIVEVVAHVAGLGIKL
jgi:hypothetical protein